MTRCLTIALCECSITYMNAIVSPPTRTRSTADAQRSKIVSRAVKVFARAGYHATPVTEIATAAGVSPAYVFRLFPGKIGLFVAAVDHCYALVRAALAEGAEVAAGGSPGDILEAMSQAYIDLIRDRDLIMLQVHAQGASDVPEIRAAVQRGLSALTDTASSVSGADATSVQRFIAYGQLCHLVVLADLSGIDETWAHTISSGIRHHDPEGA